MIALDTLRSDAARLLREGAVKLVMGYRARDERRVPVLLTQSEHTDMLFYDGLCKHNLAAYLRKTEVRDLFPLAIVARPEVMRSLLVLSAESQIPGGAVTVLGVSENEYHGVLDLPATAKLLKERFADLSPDEALLAKVRGIAAMSPEDRAAFWSEAFSHCTRCYACRAACPGCYCQWCLAKKNVPQWISAVVRPHGNYSWNITRAFHHAGRCTLCGACEAACPQKLPLMLLNIWIDQQVREEFDCKPGYDADDKPLIGSWRSDDNGDFIR